MSQRLSESEYQRIVALAQANVPFGEFVGTDEEIWKEGLRRSGLTLRDVRVLLEEFEFLRDELRVLRNVAQCAVRLIAAEGKDLRSACIDPKTPIDALQKALTRCYDAR